MNRYVPLLTLLIACGGEDLDADFRPDPLDRSSPSTDAGAPDSAGSVPDASMGCEAPLVWGSCLDGSERCRRRRGTVVIYDYGPDVVLDGLCDDNFTSTAVLDDNRHLAIDVSFGFGESFRLVVEHIRTLQPFHEGPACTGELLSGCQHKTGALQFIHRINEEILVELSYRTMPEMRVWASDPNFAGNSDVRVWIYASVDVMTERGLVPRVITLDVSTVMTSQ